MDEHKNLPRATHAGKLTIGDMTFPCSVLSDGTRILTQSDFMTGMGMYYSGWVAKNRPTNQSADIPHFLAFKSINPYIDKHLGDLQSIVVKYRTNKGTVAHGIKAEIIPKICEVWLDAAEHTRLGSRQAKIAQKASIIIRALAHVGIIALVDEATGYQEERARDELQKILQAYISEELLPWTRRFPNEFYQQMFRLKNWPFPPATGRKGAPRGPRYAGKLTKELVYEKLPPGVLKELEEKNPPDQKWQRRYRHHQWLTNDIGNPHLEKQVAIVTTLMRISPNWRTFHRNFERAFPSGPQQLEMGFMEESEPDLD